MRSWKKATDPRARVFLYFRAHRELYFSAEHIAAQIGIGCKLCRHLLLELLADGKLHAAEVVEAKKWGRPRTYYRAIRTSEDSLQQLEVFKKAADRAGFLQVVK